MVLENNLLIVFFVLLALAALAGLGFALWKPVGRRAWRYVKFWWQQDKLDEAQAKAEAQARKKAREELAEACGEALPTKEIVQETAAQNKSDCAPSAPAQKRLPQTVQPPKTETPKISLIQRK